MAGDYDVEMFGMCPPPHDDHGQRPRVSRVGDRLPEARICARCCSRPPAPAPPRPRRYATSSADCRRRRKGRSERRPSEITRILSSRSSSHSRCERLAGPQDHAAGCSGPRPVEFAAAATTQRPGKGACQVRRRHQTKHRRQPARGAHDAKEGIGLLFRCCNRSIQRHAAKSLGEPSLRRPPRTGGQAFSGKRHAQRLAEPYSDAQPEACSSSGDLQWSSFPRRLQRQLLPRNRQGGRP